MKSKMWMGAALLALVAGCHAPMARVTPAEADGGRVSLAGGSCHTAQPATTETMEEAGHVYAKLKLENHTDQEVAFDSRSVRFIDGAGARNPWVLQRKHVVAPRSHRELDLRVSSHGIRCDREMTVAFTDSLSIDGRKLTITPLRFLPTEDRRLTLAER